MSLLRFRLTVLGVAFTSLCGCLVSPADFRREKAAIESSTGLSLEPTTSVRLGALALSLARSSDPRSRGLVEQLERVEVAVFKVSGGSPRRAVGAFPAGPRWTCVVQAREKDGAARIFLEETSGRLGHLLIVASERDELTLVRLEGSFDGLLEAALSGHTLQTLGHAVEDTPEVEKDDEDID